MSRPSQPGILVRKADGAQGDTLRELAEALKVAKSGVLVTAAGTDILKTQPRTRAYLIPGADPVRASTLLAQQFEGKVAVAQGAFTVLAS